MLLVIDFMVGKSSAVSMPVTLEYLEVIETESGFNLVMVCGLLTGKAYSIMSEP